jgi:NAD(P)-dependent dehydrogenase (short-subunit alcohol dehydrogenase family)
MSPESKIAEGFELQFGVNFLGHFALTQLLYGRLRNTINSRMVTQSSIAHSTGSLDFDKL